jgi:hypothetical protein
MISTHLTTLSDWYSFDHVIRGPDLKGARLALQHGKNIFTLSSSADNKT